MNKERLDQQLIESVIAQDRKAQFQLFELTKRMVYSLAFRILNDEDTAHDVLQDTYVKVFQEIRNLKHPEALISWMKTITARTAIEKGKKKFQFEELSSAEDQVEDQLAGEVHRVPGADEELDERAAGGRLGHCRCSKDCPASLTAAPGDFIRHS